MEYNIYCDESCYLEHDNIDKMGFGCISIPKSLVRKNSILISEIQKKHKCCGELKWIKVSPSRIGFYKNLVDYFASNKLNFRALVVENKSLLDHATFNRSSHDEFYYKMYYFLLRNIFDNRNVGDTYNIYVDIKDTHSSFKLKKLHEVIKNYMHDFNSDIILKFQIIRSDESRFMQLADFILGAVMYKSRGLNDSNAKKEIVNYLENCFGYNLDKSNEPWQQKLSLFHFEPRISKGVCTK